MKNNNKFNHSSQAMAEIHDIFSGKENMFTSKWCYPQIWKNTGLTYHEPSQIIKKDSSRILNSILSSFI